MDLRLVSEEVKLNVSMAMLDQLDTFVFRMLHTRDQFIK
jgi:hypothetical protein